MIALLVGQVAAVRHHSAVILTTGGVGYAVALTPAHAAAVRVGETVTLTTYLKVSDAALDLYGFENTGARDFFELLLTVSGVGPKSAMNILSLGAVGKIQSAIARGDVAYLTSVQGMGKKTAERLVVELKSKIQQSGSEADATAGAVPMASAALGEVVEGLVAMGYSAAEARSVVEHLSMAEGKSSEVLLREALQQLAK